jgi:DNA repair protein RecN (Recombination protein N)
MLIDLKISNFALIERAEIGAGTGFNVLTGETGAGKSILIKAMGLLIGERATGDQVGTKSPKAVVEAAFDITQTARAKAFLEDKGIETDDDCLIISREVEKNGRSKVRLNGRIANNSTLRELGELLVDFHGQHENQKLLHSEAHLGFLDAFGDKKHAQSREKVRELYKAWREVERKINELSRNEQERAQRLDMLQFQATEIDKAKLESGEDETLAEDRTRLMNAESLRSSADECAAYLYGDEEPGALSLARQALKAAKSLQQTDEKISEWVEQMQSAILELEDAAESARDYAHALEADPQRLEQIEARLFKINRLKRKYGSSTDEIIAYRQQIEGEIQSLNFSDEQIADLKTEAANRQKEFFTQAQKLSDARKKLAKSFGSEVVKQLSGLAMEKARFEVGFETLEKGSGDGIDKCEFLFSANPGQPLRPLARIASGGEISRVMLGLRTVLRGTSEETSVPVVIFDEVDTGIGGLTAEKVGEKMQQIAVNHQVFCITHLPQIAKRADHHFRVEKRAGRDETKVDVTPLEGDDRILEIARMLGSESQSNLDHARDLLGLAKRE